MSGNLVTIATCGTEAEADGLSAALRLSAIEHVVRRRTNGSSAFEIAVQEADSDRADDIVNAIYGVSARDAEEAVAPSEPERTCEVCGSADIARTPKLALFLLGAVIAIGVTWPPTSGVSPLIFFLLVSLAIVLLVLDTWRCRECGHGWK